MSYDQFWLRYLRAHARPQTRMLHYAGSLLALLSYPLFIEPRFGVHLQSKGWLAAYALLVVMVVTGAVIAAKHLTR